MARQDLQAVIAAMKASGCTSEQIVAVIENLNAAAAASRDNIREENARRQRECRARKKAEANAALTAVTRDSCDKGVTSPSPSSLPPTPPNLTTPNPSTPSPPKGGSVPKSEVILAHQAYEVVAGRAALPSARLTVRRFRRLRQLLALHGTDAWLAGLSKLEASPFCRGEGKNGWRANFDFLLDLQKFERLLEGNYDGQAGKGRAPPRSALDIFKATQKPVLLELNDVRPRTL